MERSLIAVLISCFVLVIFSKTIYQLINTIYFILFYFQFIYRWQILFHLTIRLAFHKQQGLSQTSGAINNIAECCYRWHQIFETELQFAVLIKVNILTVSLVGLKYFSEQIHKNRSRHQSCSIKKVFLKTLQNLQENICVGVFF